MKIIAEKIETVMGLSIGHNLITPQTKKRYITINNETEEAQKTKAYLYNTEANDPGLEDKRKAIFEKIDKLTNSRFDCDIELKSHIDEYNNFKKTFEDQCVE